MVERECHVPIPQKARTNLKKKHYAAVKPIKKLIKISEYNIGKKSRCRTKKSDIFGRNGRIARDNEVQS